MASLSLAFRNLARNRRRSVATLLSLAIGSCSILLFGGYSKNISYSMETAYVRRGGHIQIQHRDYYALGSGNPSAYGIASYKNILSAIAADPVLSPMVIVATPALQFGGIAGNYAAGVSRTVLGFGVVPEATSKMREWNDLGGSPTAPSFPLLGASPDSAIVGVGVARVLLLCKQLGVSNCPAPPQAPKTGADAPDDIAELAAKEQGAPAADASAKNGAARVEVLATASGGAPNVASLKIVKAEPQGFKELDDVALTLALPQAQLLLYGAADPRATSIDIQLRHSWQVPAAQARLAALLPAISGGQPLAALDFRQLNPFLTQTQQLFDTIFNFIAVLIGGIVLFTVGNTMNTAVVERTVEIGTLRAIGLRQSGIRRLFLAEGLILGVSGAVFGVAAALAAAYAINHLGVTWLPPTTTTRQPLAIRVWGEWALVAEASVGLALVAAASAWWPARRAARLAIVEALRHT